MTPNKPRKPRETTVGCIKLSVANINDINCRHPLDNTEEGFMIICSEYPEFATHLKHPNQARRAAKWLSRWADWVESRKDSD